MKTLTDEVVFLKMSKSKSEAKRKILSGKIAVNNVLEKDPQKMITKKDNVQGVLNLESLLFAKKPKKGYNFEFIDVVVFDNKYGHGILIKWGATGVGFGEVAIFIEDGKLKADTECMNREFVEALLVAAKDKIFEKMEII